MSKTPNWQPISQLPLIAQMIDEELNDTQSQYQNLQPAVARPHILDDYTVERLIKVFGERQEFFGIYGEQLSRWKALNLNTEQKQELERLEKQLEKLVEVNSQIVTLAKQLQSGTIEKVLGKSDLELGLEALRKIKF
ncbi:MAG: hypothetical protein AAF378_11290 [Cyanobacteria bacterium P01_A01_bin.84]